ncbi:MAG: LacI family DNA-binding transcriptional regulator [Anaerolineae bacterium]
MPNNWSVTIKDVAERAGVSESTVSRVLSGTETAIPFSEETRERVAQAARELGYRPHPGARALRGKATNLLGVIVREIDDPFFAQLIEAISNEAGAQGYDLVLGYAKSDPEEALALSEILDLRFCDGLLLLGDLCEAPEEQHALLRLSHNDRMVAVCRGDQPSPAWPAVGVNNRQGVRLGLDYLTGLGHRRIAYVDTGRVGDLRDRLQAYHEYMAEMNGSERVGYVETGANSFEGGYSAMSRLLALPVPPTAVMTADDTMAIGALAAAADAGVHVPHDLSLIGFDDIRIASFLRPALTTIRQPLERIAAEAVALIVDMVRQREAPRRLHRFLAPELVVRASCAPPIP